MARVFLSYDREDGAKARAIATALEKNGHSVWWDRHIKGGAQYSKEIEAALKSADAVVVLWSERSVDSAWVRDEAAAGRDTNRLVPVRLDATDPPIGFRQYQEIDLSRWNGRRRPPQTAEILAAIDALRGPNPSEPSRPATAMLSAVDPRVATIGLIATLVAAALAVAFLLVQRQSPGRAHVVAVTASDAAAGPLARDLLAILGSLQSARSGPPHLVSDTNGKADLTLETTADLTSGQPGAGLILKSGKDQGILWSRDFAQASGAPADFKQHVALTAWRALDCAVAGLDAEGEPLEPQLLKLFLNSCARYAEVASNEAEAVIPQFRDLTRKAPGFRPAWAMLLLAQSDFAGSMIDQRFAEMAALRSQLRNDAGDAQRLDPAMVEVALAQAAILPRNAHLERLRILDAAKDRNPDHHLVLDSRARGLMRVGRLREAIEESKRASELAPWSPRALSAYVQTLAFSGRTEAAYAELRRAERLWPDTPALREAQYNYHWHFGDPLLALKLTPPGLPRGREMFLRARAEPTAANIEHFLTFIRSMYQRMERTDISPAIVQEFAAFHREDELYERILDPRNRNVDKLSAIFFEPPLKVFRRDPRFMLAARKAGLVDYWLKSGKWPDFCFEEDPPYDCKAEAAKLAG